MSSMGDNTRSNLPASIEPSELGNKNKINPNLTQKRPYKVCADVWEHFTKTKFHKMGRRRGEHDYHVVD